MTEHTVRVRINTIAGPLAVVGTERGVTEIYFDKGRSSAARGRGGTTGRTERGTVAQNANSSGAIAACDDIGPGAPSDIPAPVREAIRQLEQYFRGERTTFDFDMQYDGTEFQRRVWSYLLTIPAGETRTYGEVARSLGKPTAARAVGGAVGSNPLSIVIPCHRVVAADGSGGGYGGGMEAKEILLQIEGISWRSAGEVRSD